MNYITLLLMAGVSGVLIIASIVGFPIYAQTPTELSTFKVPQGKIYLQYPSDWTAQGKENRFDALDLKISKTTAPPFSLLP